MNEFDKCLYLSQQLGWGLQHHYRITRWLERVGIATTGIPLAWTMPIPRVILEKLSERLELRLECQKLLDLLQWDWQHPEVKKVEAKFGCNDELPRLGYLELRKALDEWWFENGGGF